MLSLSFLHESLYIPANNLSALLPLLNLNSLSGLVDFLDPKPAKYFQTFQQIVEGAGFEHQSHSVTTADGYTLNVFRIMNKEV